jgi:hypothetical protein
MTEESHRADPEGIERRISTRYPCSLSTSCRLIASVHGGPKHVRVRNISATGISLVVPLPYPSNSIITIQLHSMPRDLARSLDVRVVYCVEHPSGETILGGSFVNNLSDPDLRAFLA